MKANKGIHTFLLYSVVAFPTEIIAGNGKLLEHAGITQLEGSAGGGLVPWATLSGFDSKNETAAGVFMSHTNFQDYGMFAYGATISLYDRVEISFAKQSFELKNIPLGITEINQSILGIKGRIIGDMIYTDLPQISAGIQYKSLHNSTIATALGATDSEEGYDAYIAITKAHLGILFGYNLAWNATFRLTKANQFGLLGFGGDENDHYQLMPEGSIAVFLNRHIVAGVEYRSKPDNLSLVIEDDAFDGFIAFLPNKHLNVTLAWVNLGSIAGSDTQTGPYVALTGYLW